MTESTDSSPESQTLGSQTPQTSDQLDKDPSSWVTGDEPMTPSQRSYLDTLASQAGEEISADLTKAEASEHIDRLQAKGAPEADA
ncbi:MAG: DUF3072 domain-containing protein [Ornithinimicrobium sp.]